MNIKDLRIGNTVLFATTEAEVLGINPESIVYRYNDSVGNITRECLLQGIAALKLTKEHLRRFGFTLMNESEHTLNTYELDGFQLWDKKGDFSEVEFLTNRDSILIKSVHELQNLFFALKGKELYLEKNNHE